MEESTTYQVIVAKGRAEGEAKGRTEGALAEVRKLIVRLGKDKFGTDAPAAVRKLLKESDDVDQLEQLVLRVPHSRSWKDLLTEPAKRKRG